MPLSFKIIASPEGETITDWILKLPDDGGTIGRSYVASIQLSDQTRKISGIHAVINRSARGYRIQDQSTNGLFINGARKPLGEGMQTTLNDGDIVDIGGYRLMCSCFIPAQAQSKDPVLETQKNDPFRTRITANSDAASEPPPNTNTLPPIFATPDPVTIEPDPFTGQNPEHMPQRHSDKPLIDLSDNIGFDDDPFSDAFRMRIPAHSEAPSAGEEFAAPVSTPNLNQAPATTDVAALLNWQNKQQRLYEQAADMAINRLLKDLDPEALEDLFSHLSEKSWFSKPNYWDSYKKFFRRQLENEDWSVKFRAYFHECSRMLQQRENH
ncbi:Uncharacterised protein [BD1-7 clade bacterium]|uniref:FHA domain-containing protein n=1 Tax=BD1-7 clade bacterium TaxID=2029982 RepID=A0A5S9QAE2_9GAMM|nr:Uncharacterised protein [BD1-7 clade bacterium]CAA0115066.1 Uncharacterised protein [BD1-7 clade bacterium]